MCGSVVWSSSQTDTTNNYKAGGRWSPANDPPASLCYSDAQPLGEVTFLKHGATGGQTNLHKHWELPRGQKRAGEREGAIVFEWIYMRLLLRISRFCSVTCAVPLPLLVIPPITCLSLPLSLLSVPLRITGVCQSPIREGCWVMGENRSALLWSPGPHSARLPRTHTKHILTPKYKHAYVCAQRRWIYA